MKRSSLLLLVSLLSLAAVACSGGSSSPTEPADISASQVEAALSELLNVARNRAGISPPLSLDQAVSQVARAHSEAMRDRDFFSHVGPDGKNLRARLRASGIPFRSAGENLAQVDGASDPAGMAHRMLMDSASHRENILSERFSVVGVGVAKRGSTFWVTQIFIEP